MARMSRTLAKILYFCNVKIQMRHVVAGLSSVFRASTLLETSNPNDGGNSNVRKGLAFGTLTHRIGVFICQNQMEKVKMTQQDALLQAENRIQVSTLFKKGGKV